MKQLIIILLVALFSYQSVSYYKANLQKDVELISQLQQKNRVLFFYLYCNYVEGFRFKIVEGYRPPEVQVMLYAKGRLFTGENVVTYAKENQSKHQTARAFDIQTINCTYKSIADVAARFGIQNGGGFRNLHDSCHFEY